MLEIFIGPMLMVGFFVSQLNTSRKIVIQTEFNKLKGLLSLIIAIAVLVIFWTNDFIYLIMLFILALLILLYGFLPEGLTPEGVARFGVIAGSYDRYEKVEIDCPNQKNISVTFYLKANRGIRKKGNRNRPSFSFKFPEQVTEDDIIYFFEEAEIQTDIVNKLNGLQLNA